MENLQKVMEALASQEFKVSNGKVNQVERNNTKAELLEAIGLDLPEGALIGKCKEGLVVEVPNDVLGAITFVLDIKIKGLDWDSLSVIEDYDRDKAEKALAAEERKKTAKATYNNAQRAKAFTESKGTK